MSDMSTDTTTPATDRELVQIEGKARATTVMHWPELVRVINRLRQAEAENDRLRNAEDAIAPYINELKAENDRLREALTLVGYPSAIGQLVAERDRLREALEQIEARAKKFGFTGLVEIARAALSTGSPAEAPTTDPSASWSAREP
jgi:gamma-glutamyl:cysteine ligase YbdK (ATP-grasp superfamily)